MEKIRLMLSVLVLLFITALPVRAEYVAGNSAVLISSNNNTSQEGTAKTDYYLKKKAIKRVMEKYDSPMTEALDGFIETCGTYDLDCYLLPSIAILESTFGKHILPGSHNPFGWGGGRIMFDTWEEGIDAVGKGLRQNYINKGAVSIDEIAPIYSESPTWAVRVNMIHRMFEREEAKIQLFLDNRSVQL